MYDSIKLLYASNHSIYSQYVNSVQKNPWITPGSLS